MQGGSPLPWACVDMSFSELVQDGGSMRAAAAGIQVDPPVSWACIDTSFSELVQDDDQYGGSSRRHASGAVASFEEGLRPFLGDRSQHFMHELRNFAASHLTIQ
eukprot:scaffold5991_cov19-Tisochrysis_lutea.AAC.1